MTITVNKSYDRYVSGICAGVKAKSKLTFAAQALLESPLAHTKKMLKEIFMLSSSGINIDHDEREKNIIAIKAFLLEQGGQKAESVKKLFNSFLAKYGDDHIKEMEGKEMKTNFKKGDYQTVLRLEDGTCATKTVSGYIAGDIGVEKKQSGSYTYWAATYIPSGLLIGTDFSTRQNAFEESKVILEKTDKSVLQKGIEQLQNLLKDFESKNTGPAENGNPEPEKNQNEGDENMEEKMKNELKEREAYHIESKRIVKKDGLYSLQEMESFLSDSCNPQGEYVYYWKDVKAYKTLSGAKKGIVNLIKHHFPAGHDLEHIINSILAKIDNEQTENTDNLKPDTSPKDLPETTTDFESTVVVEESSSVNETAKTIEERTRLAMEAYEANHEIQQLEDAFASVAFVEETPQPEPQPTMPMFDGVEVKAFRFGKKMQRTKLVFTGDTKPHKESIKALGKAWWNQALSRWEVDVTDTPLAEKISFIAPQAA